ncbi:MAG: hypothetical protein NC543_09835 [bacterium]|nr:hypothetical protein [bacterium]MCM1376169.1 hypothetical protein [Muribaculum sp.]
MENKFAYDKLFHIICAKDMVIFEDDFVVKKTKNEIMYGLVRIHLDNRNYLLDELGDCNKTVASQLEDFLIEFDKVFEVIKDWQDEVPYNDIETAICIIQKKEECHEVAYGLREKYDAINVEEWKNRDQIIAILASYGAGLEVPALYKELFDEYVQKSGRWERFRVFRDYFSEAEENFKKYICKSIANEGTVVCIIDDQLKGKKCAKEIVNSIENMKTDFGERGNISGLIFSTFENEDSIDDQVFFEYIDKNKSRNAFQMSLIKSAYSFLLYKLKDIYLDTLKNSFEEAIKNKHVAYYLSSMAAYEGTTNYQVVANWIKLLFEYKLSDRDELASLAGMTRLINYLEDEKVEFSKEMLALNTFEAFDYSINKYHEPIASGDVFIIKKKIYILVGQDCDMMNRMKETRKNGISELISASTVLQTNVNNSVVSQPKYIFISNFLKNKNENAKALKIYYTSREFIENQILELCQFNTEGKSILDMNEPEYCYDGTEPIYYDELYSHLYTYFDSLLKIDATHEKELKIITNSEQSKRLVNLSEYIIEKKQSKNIEYPVQRICRIRHSYMLYIYKMFLEHQGRHPFNCMNMTRIQEIQVKTIQNENISLTVDVILSPDRDINLSSIGNLEWYVDKNALEDTLSRLINISVNILDMNESVKIGLEGTPLNYILESGEKKTLIIKKIEDKVSIE